MTIYIGNYRIEPSLGAVRYDLYKTHTIMSGKKAGETNFRPEAYGITLEKAIGIIINDSINDEVEVIELQDFIGAYNEVSARVLEELRGELAKL